MRNKIINILCSVLKFLGLKFEITQYRCGRKLFGGKYYYIFPKGLIMGCFWSDQQITSCLSETLEIEEY